MSGPSSQRQRLLILIIVVAIVGATAWHLRAWEQRERQRLGELMLQLQQLDARVAGAGVRTPKGWNDSISRFAYAQRNVRSHALALIETIELSARRSSVEITSLSIRRDSVIRGVPSMIAVRFAARGPSTSVLDLLARLEAHRPLLRIPELSLTQLAPFARGKERDEVVLDATINAVVAEHSITRTLR